MTDPETTDTNWKAKYAKFEGKFDPLWAAIGASHWTLAAFLIWTVACVAFGFWAGHKP